MTQTIPASALTQHIAVLGKTGSGKTSTAKLAVEQVVAAGSRVCILDPIKSDWWGLTSSADGRRAGLPFQILGGPRAHVPLHADAGAAIGELVATGALPLSIIDMADFKPGGQARFFTAFAEALLKHARGVLYLVMEEAHEFAPKERSGVGDENMSVYYAKKIATAGRSKGLRLIACSQRVQSLHNALLGSCETVIVHRLTAPADQEPVVKWLRSNVQDKEQRAEIERSLPKLKTGEGWLCETGELHRIQFPRIKTFDNSATPDSDATALQVVTAPVNTNKLRELIGDAVAEAEANDPKLLKSRIAELERELRKPRELAVDAGLLERTKAEGFTDGYRLAKREQWGEVRNEVANRLRNVAAQINASLLDLTTELNFERDSGQGFVSPIPPPFASPASKEARPNSLHRLQAAAERKPGNAITKAKESHKKAAASDLPAPQQKILDQLAWLENHGLSPAPKETLAAVCGVSPTSGGYFNNLGKLRSAGLIDYPTGGVVAFTDAGRRAANVADDDGREVFEHWLEIVTEPQRKILQVLIDVHPQAIAKDELADSIGVSNTSGGYFNNLGKLRTLGAIDYPTKGFVSLTQYVMP